MIRFFSALVAVCILATPAIAQQNKPQQLENVTREKSGAWTVECGTIPQNKTRICQMQQVVNDPKTKKPAVQAAILKSRGDKGPAALLRLITPLALWLRPGINMTIDGAGGDRLAFEYCLRDGCVAQLALSAGKVNALKRGSNAQLVVQSIRRQKVTLTLSLRGFTAAYGKL